MGLGLLAAMIATGEFLSHDHGQPSLSDGFPVAG
jgi:hypothetical protein